MLLTFNVVFIAASFLIRILGAATAAGHFLIGEKLSHYLDLERWWLRLLDGAQH
jgi:hypothetical protein